MDEDKVATSIHELATIIDRQTADHTSLMFSVATIFILAVTAYLIFNQVKAMRESTEKAHKATEDEISANSENSRLRATLDVILHTQCNDAHCARRTEFVSLRDDNDGDGIAAIAQHAHTHHEKAAIVRDNLNHYEMIAIGISMGILDAGMYKRYYVSTFIKDWDACSAFVVQIRRKDNNDNLYIEYENLVKAWRS